MISILVNSTTNAVRAMMSDDELYLTGGIFVDSIPEGMTMNNASDYDYDGHEFTVNEDRRTERLLLEQKQAENPLLPIDYRVSVLEEKVNSLDGIDEALGILLGVE